jgi:hypothetical protein
MGFGIQKMACFVTSAVPEVWHMMGATFRGTFSFRSSLGLPRIGEQRRGYLGYIQDTPAESYDDLGVALATLDASSAMWVPGSGCRALDVDS